VIRTTTLRTFAEVAKLDHLVYKFNIYKVLTGMSDKKPEDFASHTGCRLGKWYFEGAGKKNYSSLPAYRDMDAPHKVVHVAGREAVDNFYKSNFSAVLSAVQEMEAASAKVLELLEQLAEAGTETSIDFF
jgi:hypothetical protein